MLVPLSSAQPDLEGESVTIFCWSTCSGPGPPGKWAPRPDPKLGHKFDAGPQSPCDPQVEGLWKADRQKQ